MTETKITAPTPSAGTDAGQSNKYSDILADFGGDVKPFYDPFNDFDPNFLRTMSMPELYDRVFAVNPPIIDGLLYSGVYLFVGAPKVGKSFLMAQLAYHVSTGTAMWNYEIKPVTVLYLALEDDYARLQSRFYRMFGTDSADNLHFSTVANSVNGGLENQLRGFLEAHKDTKLVIIDTLQKVREESKETYSYANDYQIIARLKAFAGAYGICLMLVHHTRKQQADDKFDMISGTNGLLGAADGALVLHKEKRTANAAILEISGRDQQDQKLYLTRNQEKLTWELDRAETDLWKEPPEPLLEIISKKITPDCPTWQGSPTELVAFLGVEIQPNALSMKLNVNAGRLLQNYGISYAAKRTHGGRQIFLSRVDP